MGNRDASCKVSKYSRYQDTGEIDSSLLVENITTSSVFVFHDLYKTTAVLYESERFKHPFYNNNLVCIMLYTKHNQYILPITNTTVTTDFQKSDAVILHNQINACERLSRKLKLFVTFYYE